MLNTITSQNKIRCPLGALASSQSGFERHLENYYSYIYISDRQNTHNYRKKYIFKNLEQNSL